MNEGEVILTPIPQADGQVKNRPAVVLRELPPYRDLLICGVSTQVQHCVPDDFLGRQGTLCPWQWSSMLPYRSRWLLNLDRCLVQGALPST